MTKILYSKNGTVYVAGRSSDKGTKAISDIKKILPNSTGRLEFLQIDLADLTTIKPAAKRFMAEESSLHVLVHNAGVMFPPSGSVTTQGYELQMGTNCLGPFLLTQCLLPMLNKTASTSPPGSVRVTWAASSAVDVTSPKGGVVIYNSSTGEPKSKQSPAANYGQSKTGNLFLAHEFARRYPFQDSKIIANSWNPGNLKTELQRHVNAIGRMAMNAMLFHPRFGAYTELWAGWSEEAGKAENNGRFIWPWGRFGGFRKDIQESLENGTSSKFWEWCESVTTPFLNETVA